MWLLLLLGLLYLYWLFRMLYVVVGLISLRGDCIWWISWDVGYWDVIVEDRSRRLGGK